MQNLKQTVADLTWRTIVAAAPKAGLSSEDVHGDTEVFEEGLVDSALLVDLVGQIEAHTGRKVDMTAFYPDEIDTLDELAAELFAALTPT